MSAYLSERAHDWTKKDLIAACHHDDDVQTAPTSGMSQRRGSAADASGRNVKPAGVAGQNSGQSNGQSSVQSTEEEAGRQPLTVCEVVGAWMRACGAVVTAAVNTR